jgi:hypothetical protein
VSGRGVSTGLASLRAVTRPSRFEAFRYLGDKRTQIVYDLDDDSPEVTAAVEDIMRSEQFAAFCPDTLAEARNRGYRPARGRARATAG